MVVAAGSASPEPTAAGAIRTALFCQLTKLGDALLMTPAVEAFKARFPHVAIHVLTSPAAAPLFLHNPHVAAVRTVEPERNATWLGAFRAALESVRRSGDEGPYDVAAVFEGMRITRLAALLSGARWRLGDEQPRRFRPFFTHMTARSLGYAAEAKTSLLAPLGVIYQGERPKLWLTAEEQAEAQAGLDELLPGWAEGGLVTVAPTQELDTRRWPGAFHGACMARVAEARPALRFLVLHGPGEEEQADAALAAAWAAGVPREQARRAPTALSLRAAAARQAVARLHVGNCSLPRHTAVAVGTPSLTVQGATGAVHWRYPWERSGGAVHESVSAPLSCHPCAPGDCGQPRCLASIPPEVVAARALALLAAQ